MKPYYEHAGITLYLGACEFVLPRIESEHCVCITDPHYGLDFKSEAWDKEVPQIAFNLPLNFSRVAIITGTTVMFNYAAPKWTACWHKPASSAKSLIGGFSHWSPILIYGDCKLRVDAKSLHAIQHAQKKGFDHPSPKPLALMEWLVGELVSEGETVIDPFAGSGTTLLAAKNLNRKAIGIEREERYCEIIARRLQQEIMPL